MTKEHKRQLNAQYYAEHKEYFRAYRSRPEVKVKEAERMRRYRVSHQEKLSCRYKLQNAVRRGRIKRLPCEVCGNERSHAHHEDYSKPFSVRWLCALHHLRLHSSSLRQIAGPPPAV